MKIVLDMKNTSQFLRPNKNNVILYDGKDWYVVKKEDLLVELNAKIEEKLAELDEKIEECNRINEQTQQTLKRNSEQIATMSEIIRNFIESQN